MATTMMTSTTSSRHRMKSSTDWGMTSSIVYISLENLFRIRPTGVVSKKDIGERRMLVNMPLWRFFEPIMVAMARLRVARMTNTDCPNPSAA